MGREEKERKKRGAAAESGGGSPSVQLPSLHLALASASTHHTHLHGPHQLFCWSSPKRARHFLGALRSDAATGKGSQQRGGIEPKQKIIKKGNQREERK